MPYVNQNVRDKFDEDFSGDQADNAGELNFMFTTLITEYVKRHGIKYQVLNDVVGALDGAKAEFQRRVVGPYEDQKIDENGDVYEELDSLLESDGNKY